MLRMRGDLPPPLFQHSHLPLCYLQLLAELLPPI
jgi:hypothetical protein